MKKALHQLGFSSGKLNYRYDGDGGRIKRVTPNDETIFIGSLHEVKSEELGVKSTKHIFLGDTRICSVTVGARFIEPEYSYYHTDHLGSTSDITDATGTLKQHTEYLPYGETYIMSVGAASGGEPSEYLYTGKLLDSSTGLYYYGARYYDPEIGRFTQADSIIPDLGDPQAFNRYSYARNNPIRYTDPTGHSWWSKLWDKVEDFFEGIGEAAKNSFDLLVHKPGRWLAGNAGFVASFFVAGGNPILMGAISGAWSGGYYAEQADGDIWKGALLGAGVGAFTGYIGDKSANFLKSQLGPTTGKFTAENLIKGSLITGVEFGFAASARGMAAGYAGGKGDFRDVMQGGLRGFYQGATTGAIIGGTYATGIQNMFHGNELGVPTPSAQYQTALRVSYIPNIFTSEYKASQNEKGGRWIGKAILLLWRALLGIFGNDPGGPDRDPVDDPNKYRRSHYGYTIDPERDPNIYKHWTNL